MNVQREILPKKKSTCVYGPHGSGKSTWVTQNFPGIIDVTDWDPEFIERLQITQWIFSENPEHLETFKGRDTFVFVSTHRVDGFAEYHECHRARELFGEQDVTWNKPSTFIIDNLETQKESYVHMIDQCIGEHGNSLGIIHENIIYADMSFEDISKALDSIVWANHIDIEMYKGNWDLYNYFNFFAYCVPCAIVRGRSTTRNTASMWTKYLIGCMKQKKFSEIGVDIDTLDLLRKYAERGENVMNLPRSDIDSLKIGDFYEKLKPRIIQKLKKNAASRGV